MKLYYQIAMLQLALKHLKNEPICWRLAFRRKPVTSKSGIAPSLLRQAVLLTFLDSAQALARQNINGWHTIFKA
jgi:hypothetical protein